MEDYKKDVPYIVYESEAARHERTVKRLLIALLITIVLMVGTNMAWLYVFNQYDISSEEYTIEGNDNADGNYVRPDGSYRDGGSYARGRRGNVARDSMGRYSSANDQTVQDVRMLLNRTQDENARQELSKLLDKLENM